MEGKIMTTQPPDHATKPAGDRGLQAGGKGWECCRGSGRTAPGRKLFLLGPQAVTADSDPGGLTERLLFPSLPPFMKMKTLENALVKSTDRKKTNKRPSRALPPRPATQEQVTRGSALETPPQPPAPAPAPPAPQTVNVPFSFFAPQAKRVSLCGEFNGWSQEANPMEHRAEGHWQTTLALKPGRYQYKFLADGQWTADPQAKENVLNQHGTLNSVIEVRQKI